MTCQNEIHDGDVGTEFIVTITECIAGIETPVDISTSITRKIIWLNPDGVKTEYTAAYTLPASGGVGNGTDGQISYFTTLGDLVTGSYKIQVKVTTPEGIWSSEIDRFKVKANL
ncbi:MAG TPA: hypothetical protein EYF94_02675 [Porticoccaceae bacterium]|jgi:hypothetical protein|nr:hypothetical protein [Methylococcaceae bacterium]HIK79824.1 hypothetical protein [Porticoccaceae bacterium]